MREVVHIRRYRIVGPYRLWLQFTDGLAGEWDFSGLLKDDRPVARPLHDQSFFEQVFLDFGALTWPNGFDWSPEALHADMAAAGVLKFETAAA
ncbi:MAG: hypothetical protein ACI9YM_001015 [Brevundimonas sp.]|jgi:hypothetical protein|uniref:DUF2442 domain-containing protein n=1 Tax=Brevundimonas sp. TaxID=1871086 RepID=UPI0039E2D56A|tara:strand:- start:1138 stop:1416 length:279 start_codon:yes stop_codon:yes gene_type:complete